MRTIHMVEPEAARPEKPDFVQLNLYEARARIEAYGFDCTCYGLKAACALNDEAARIPHTRTRTGQLRFIWRECEPWLEANWEKREVLRQRRPRKPLQFDETSMPFIDA